MDFYGITMKGKYWTQEVETLPEFSLNDVGRIIYVTSLDEIYYGGTGSWKRYYVEEEETLITTPTVSLRDSEEVSIAQPLKILSTPFETDNGVDFHQSTTWRIYSSDGNVLIWESLSYTELTSIFLPLNTLESNTDYIFSAMYNGVYGSSGASVNSITTPTIENTIDETSLEIGDFFEGGYYVGKLTIDDKKYILLSSSKSQEMDVEDTNNIIPATTLYNVNASYNSLNYLFSSYNGNITDFAFNYDGTILVLYASGALYSFTLSIPWNITSVSYVKSGYANSGTLGFYIRDDGEKMYTINNAVLYEYTMSTPWDVSTLTYVGTKSLSYACGSFTISKDGRYIYTANASTGVIYQFSMTTPWDISTITYVGTITIAATYIKSIDVSPDGKIFFFTNYSSRYVYKYTLTTPWNISGFSTYTRRYLSEAASPNSVRFYNGGANVYMYSPSTDRMYQYTSDSLAGTTEQDGFTNTNNLKLRFSEENIFYTAHNIVLNNKDDWYIPSRYESDIIYRNVKPSVDTNIPNIENNIYGITNLSSYTTSVPTQTEIDLFKTSEFFNYSSTAGYITSTMDSYGNIYSKSFKNGSLNIADDMVVNKLRLIRKLEY